MPCPSFFSVRKKLITKHRPRNADHGTRNMRTTTLILATFILTSGLPVLAQKAPLLPERDVAALANELSGETAKRNLEGIARFHRQRGSVGCHGAAELVA